MAINIQEILHPSDSSQIKWEKVNYNFDQILANGGGPIGQKGTKGSQGSVGQTGAKGQKGAQGLKGETGTTTSRWETIPVNPDNATNYVILKPKLESDTYHPVIFLGDQTYDNVNNNDGLTGLRSTLVIGRHASTSDEYLTFWHGPINGTVNNVSITLESSEEVDGDGNTFVKYKLAETFGSDLNNPAETVEFNLGTDKFSIGNGIGTNVYFLGANSTFKLPESAIASPEAGMVRYYQGQYWGAVDNAGTVSWTPFCMSPCGGGGYSGTITLNPADNIEVNYDGSVYGNSIEITNGEDVEVDVNGDPWTGSSATTTQATSATTTVAAQTIEFDSVTWTPSSGVSASANSQSFLYLIDGVAGQLLNSGLVTAPSWITFSTYSGGANNNRAEFTIAENTSTNQRSGVIAITHPNNSSITDSISIIQVGVSATAATTQATQATAATTQATQATAATTQATAATTLPLYTASMANLSVSDGLEGTPTSYTWAQNGPSVITFNPSTMGEGNTTYTLVLQVGAGYSNSGQQVNVSATATGAPAYMISYDANGGSVGSGGGTGANTGGAGLTVNANSFVRDGFTFDTWNTSYMGTGTSYAPGSVPPTSAFTGTNGIYDELQLYARWSSSATVATTTVSSGSGSGSGCYTYNLYNSSTTTVAGTLYDVANCSGSGNVGVFLGQYSSQSICTDAPIAQIQMSLGSIGGYNVTVSQAGAC